MPSHALIPSSLNMLWVCLIHVVHNIQMYSLSSIEAAKTQLPVLGSCMCNVHLSNTALMLFKVHWCKIQKDFCLHGRNGVSAQQSVAKPGCRSVPDPA